MYELKKLRYIDFATILDFDKWCAENGVPVWVETYIFWHWLGIDGELEIPVVKDFVSE